MKSSRLIAGLWALASTTSARLVPAERVEEAALARRATATSSSTAASTSRVADSSCNHGPSTRACWGSGFSIATDFDQKHPTTSKTVTAYWDITNKTCNPDGNGEKYCFLVNGQYPGPLLRANWGDTIQVTVKNSMQNNGTGIHWHGVRQLNTNPYDGVPGMTECPLAPGDTKTYTFQATQFGTSWYHSHYTNQYGNGVVGTMIFDGPATANYDADLGTFPVTDWYYNSVYNVGNDTLQALQAGGPGPGGDNILVNGTNKSPSNKTGTWSQTTIQPGKKYRLRLINTSVNNAIRVTLDNHPFSVIANDFVPIKPYNANWILMAIGQRYDVVFTANQTAGNYWFRAEVAQDCLDANNGVGRAIFTYASATAGTPTSNAAALVSPVCRDPTAVPFWYQPVPSSAALSTLPVGLTRSTGHWTDTANGTHTNRTVVLWALNTTAIDVQWDRPTLDYFVEKNTSYPKSANVINLPSEGQWTYWVVSEVSNTPQIPHPIHLHGHDFYVLGSGAGQAFNAATANLNWDTPDRRDTAVLPAGGWLALAFETNNPGAWLMHCHIAWHISEGLGLQFIESVGTAPLPDQAWQKTCSNYDTYYKTSLYKQDDSGL